MKTKRNHAFTLIELLVVITIIAILASLAVPAFNMVQTNGNQMKGVSNCKQIIIGLKQFAKDNNSQYPDTVTNPLTGGVANTSNDAFRMLVQEQISMDERIFGCPAGFNPDNNLGTPPGYGMALQGGENHWAMTQGQTDTTVGSMPIVYENPAAPGWPPMWNADVAGQIKLGRTWPGGVIIIGRNDGSVSVEKLSGKSGMVGPKMMTGGMDIFRQSSPGQPQRVLQIMLGGMAGNGTSGMGQGAGYPGAPLGGQPGLPPAPLGGQPGGYPPAPLGGQPGGLPPSPLGN